MIRLSTLPLGLALVYSGRIIFHAYRRQLFPPQDPDSLVVLGTAQYDGRASRQFAARLDHAVALWQAGIVHHLYTVGGNLPGDRFTEAGVGRDYLIEHGVPAEKITAVAQGNDTRGSYQGLLAQHPVLGTVLVVTDPHHSLRAESIARQLEIAAFASPTTTSPVQFPAKAWWITLSHEMGGLVVVDVSRVIGSSAADKVEDALRRLQAGIRPSRRARHRQLAAEKEES